MVPEFSWCGVMMPKTELSLPDDIMQAAGNSLFTKHTAGDCITCLLACSPDMNMYLHHHQVSPRNEALFIVRSDL